MTMRVLILVLLAFVATFSFARASDAVVSDTSSEKISTSSLTTVQSPVGGDIVESRPLPSVLYALNAEEELSKTSAPIAPSVPPALAAVTPAPGTENLSANELFSRARDMYGTHNFPEAFALYRQAAELGHTEAQYMTGLMLYRGEGVALADTKEAAKYYSMAAQKGFAKAQYNLAVLYYDGAGVARDDTQAYKWLYLSSLQGEPRAIKMLPVAQRNLKEEQKATAVAQAEMIRW